MKSSIAVVVLAAGAGTRMKSAMPKVLHELAGWPMVRHVLENVALLNPSRIVGVVAPGADAVSEAFAPHPTVVQGEPLGTGHAAKAALGMLEGHRGPVLVVFGDAPLITTASLRRLVDTCIERRAAVGVLGFKAHDPSAYGRLIVRDGELERIVESKEADERERAVDFCLLGAIGNDNAKGEYYLTDAVARARAGGYSTIAVEGDEEEFQGINSRAELAIGEAALQRRLRAAALEAGVSMTDPSTVWLAADTSFGNDVTIGPNVHFGLGVTVASNVKIAAFCDIEGCRIGKGAMIGPFACIRPESDVAEGVHIGNFVELKATRTGRGAKADHLACLGRPLEAPTLQKPAADDVLEIAPEERAERR
jgi:bifunctional UDP-N-acetylglucosamine pyrophosphorylase/glucosamine-1-phosphate N-acetyltransferase